MTVIRAALYVGVASVLGVWLSSAASSMAQRDPGVAVAGHVQEAGGLALEVQEQGERLRQRLAAGPPPPRPLRNPFEFAPDAPPQRATRPGRAADRPPFEPHPAAPAARELSLIGVATHQTPDGPTRTAMIATVDGELIMVRPDETVLDRFRVMAVGADSVDLLEPATGLTTRLRLGLEADQER